MNRDVQASLPQNPACNGASECRVLVAYEDHRTRERAMRMLNQVQMELGGEIGFEITWWKLSYLQAPEISMVARHYATSADIIVFASDTPGLFPISTMKWNETWIRRRAKDGGLLVPLVGSPHLPSDLYRTKHQYLRHLANQAGMDFLPPSKLNQSKRTLENRITERHPASEGLHPAIYDAKRMSTNSARLN